LSPSLRRFYVDSVLFQEGDLLQLSPRETFHLHRVLRLKAGDACQIFNRSGQGAEALIQAISEHGTELRLKKVYPLKERTLFIKAAQALPQKKKMDELVDWAEELSVHELWAIETRRTIVKMKAEAGERARKRWERIVIEAAKQSGSSVFMRVEGPLSFEQVVTEKVIAGDQPFIFHPDPQGLPFSEMLDELKHASDKGNRPSTFLFFGPEGGFTEEEVRWAESRGVRKVFLGKSILRLETAFIGVLGALRFLIS